MATKILLQVWKCMSAGSGVLQEGKTTEKSEVFHMDLRNKKINFV
jgi:hypothetical protein